MTTTAPSNALTVEDPEALPDGPVDGDSYEPYADARGPARVEWPVAVSLEVAALARQ